MAQGINLIFFIPTCVISIIVNWKNKNIEKKVALITIISGIIGAIIGAEISTRINVKELRILFGYFLIFIAIFEIYFLIKPNIKDKKGQ